MNLGNSTLVGTVERDMTGYQRREEQETPDEWAWMHHGLCRGANPSEFFPSDGLGVEAAQRICVSCPVRTECLEYALAHRIEHGVWGGASERERRRILRRRRDLAAGITPAVAPVQSSAPMKLQHEPQPH
jgi:WhiB family redox-sensing transcriptional regulator